LPEIHGMDHPFLHFATMATHLSQATPLRHQAAEPTIIVCDRDAEHLMQEFL